MIAAARAAGALSQLAQEFLTEAGSTFGVSLAGTHGSATWTAESGSYTPSDETITQASLGAFKASSKLIGSEELVQDSEIDVDEFVADELGKRIGILGEAAFISGDGSGKPLGILNAGAGYTTVTAAAGNTTSFTPAALAGALKALPLAYRSGAVWILNGDLFVNLASATDTAGGLVYPSLQFDPPSLFGRPVFLSADLASPAANAKSAVIGDWKTAYAIRRVNSVGIQRQDEVHSDSGQVGFRAFLRLDGRPALTDAARIVAHSAT